MTKNNENNESKTKSMNLKKIREQAEKIELLKAKGVDVETLNTVLDLEDEPEVILQTALEYQDYRTTEEALEIMNKKLKKPIKKYTLLDLLREGKIEGEKPSNKVGYLVHIDDIERFIITKNKSKEEILKELEQANERIKELEEQLAKANKPKVGRPPKKTETKETTKATPSKEKEETK